MESRNTPDAARIRAARLAAERTAVANDRTLMAYERTGLGLLLVGVGTAFHLPDLALVGVLLMACGVAVLGIGRWRHAILTRRVAQTRAAIDRIAGGRP